MTSRSHCCNQLVVLISVAACVAYSAPGHAQKVERSSDGRICREMHDETYRQRWSIVALESGNYCVAENLYQSWPISRLPHQSVPMSPLISIENSNVTIDLMDRHLSAKTPIARGISVISSNREPNHTIVVKNGEVITSKLPAAFMVHRWNIKNKRFGHGLSIADSYGDLAQYRPTEFILENLTLEADHHVIIMQGKKNIIRNCKIIGGNGTVNLYGPNLVFENNEIILHAKEPQKEGDESPVALYLEDAADSMVKNNRIVIEGRVSKADAIVLKNSPNVLLERNTIKGASEAYQLLDERSSVKAVGNSVQ